MFFMIEKKKKKTIMINIEVPMKKNKKRTNIITTIKIKL